MATSRYYFKRLRRIAVTPIVQLTGIFAFLFFGVQWLVNRNDSVQEFGPVGRHYKSVEDRRIDWRGMYYVQFVTSPEYLCNAVMLWNQMEEIGSHAQRMMLYPSSWNSTEIDPATKTLTPVAHLLQTAEKKYFVKLQPFDVLNASLSTKWTSQYLKFLAFNLAALSRVVVLSPTSLYLQNMDELFLFPRSPIALPHIYTGSDSWSYSTQIMLLTPSTTTFNALDHLLNSANESTTDFSLLTQIFPLPKITRIAQRPYLLLSSSFRDQSTQHKEYLAPFKGHFPGTEWDPDYMLRSVKFLSFSENSFGSYPVNSQDGAVKTTEKFPGPWKKARQDLVNKYMPDCVKSEWFGNSECSDRRVWLSLYRTFAERREGLCGVGFEMVEDSGGDSGI